HQDDIDALFRHFAAANANAATSGSAYEAGASGTIAEKLTEGARYPAFVSVAGTLRKRDLPLEVIEATIRAMNSFMCDPPKREAELEQSLLKILPTSAR